MIKAGNEFRANIEQHAQIATDSAAQPAEPPQQKKRNLGPDSEPKQPTAKAKPTTRQQKRKQDSPASVAEASDAGSVVEQDAATDTPENSKILALRLVRLTSRRLAIKAVPRQM